MVNSIKPSISLNAINETKKVISEKPELGQITLKLHSKSNGGISVLSKTGPLIQNGNVDNTRDGKFTLIGDEPVSLLGADTGVSPAEYILQGLASCYVVTLTSMATAQGIELDSIEMDLSFEIDLNGFLGLNETVRKGAKGLNIDIKLSSPSAAQEQLQQLVQDLPSNSPIHDTLANPVSISTQLV